LLFEAADGGLDPGFVADEIAVVASYLKAFQPEELANLAAMVAIEDWSWLGLQQLRDRLMVYSDAIKQYQISLLGHAHLDMAWLWNLEETWRAAERTFTSALALQQDFKELIFCHTTPVLYEWMAEHRPELFRVIQAQSQAGRWEVLGGMWVEPELNLIGAESIARQILYGQRYYQKHFGHISRIAWLPDTFGFCNQLPQFLKQGGMDYFVTQKLRWNDTTKYPHEVFAWQSPDGTAVTAFMSGPIGEGIDPPKLADYCWEWQARTGWQNPLWLPGVGDHGGGPTRDMLEIARRWQTSPFFPKLKFEQGIHYFDQLENRNLPIHQGDIYLEFHRGCYTTHGDQKAFNRDCENALYDAELWSSIATMLEVQTYPKAELEQAWKQVLLNQFHDILPGTSIHEVYEEANPAWQAALKSSKQMTKTALQTIAGLIDLPEPPMENAVPIAVFNNLGWARSQVVRLPVVMNLELAESIGWQVILPDGEVVTAYVEPDAQHWEKAWVEFPITQVPAFGYTVVWLVPVAMPLAPLGEAAEYYAIENEFLRVKINPETGDIESLWDKQNQRSVFADAANQIELFQDAGQYWDGWNIDPKYEQYPLPPSQHFEVVRMESPYVKELWSFGQAGSRGYILEQGCPWLKITVQLNGDERHVLQKACFPLNFSTDRATYETPAGIIERPTNPQTEAEKAQWEVAGLRWADMSENQTYGVSILSDRKHGYDHKPNQIRLTLLRGSEWPDPEADKGIQRFSYAVYPHAGDWRSAHTSHKARELSQPLQAIVITPNDEIPKQLPMHHSFLDLGSAHLILLGLKQSEDNSETYILRCYEASGRQTILQPSGSLFKAHQLGDRVDLLERKISDRTLTIQPWQIASFTMSLR
jgi:alpha-mannosidase